MLRFVKLPLLSMILVLYNMMYFSFGGDMSLMMSNELVGGFLFSGMYFSLVLEDGLVMFGIVLLFFEIAKSTSTSRSTTVEHIFSMFIFIIFLLEFILVPSFGTPAFLIITLLALVDVLAGFTISISTARKDINVTH